MKKHTLLPIFPLLLVLTFSSCASLINSKITQIQIVTSEPSKLTINGDVNNNLVVKKEFSVNRTKEPLEITAESANHKKTIVVNAKNSFMYWANLYWYGIGMLVDKNNPKRYTYPKTIYLNLQDTLATYQKYIPYKVNDSLNNQIKFTPLKLAGLINPGFELAYERRTSSRFSTQIMGSLLLDYDYSSPKTAGFRTSLEEKYFYRKSAPIGPYLSFEINYLQKKYYDDWYFGVADIYNNPGYKNTNYLDNYGIDKKTLSFNFKWGYQTIIKQFVIDFYAGLGLKYRNVKHFDRINPNDEMENSRHLNIYLINNEEANGWSISLPLTVKVGWVF